MTTEAQIEEMREVCKQLETSGVCTQARPDDWGKFGNFSLILTPTQRNQGTTMKLRTAVKKLLPKEAHLRQCFPPDPVYAKDWHTNKRVRDWTAPGDWVFDVDYQDYCFETNSFS